MVCSIRLWCRTVMLTLLALKESTISKGVVHCQLIAVFEDTYAEQ